MTPSITVVENQLNMVSDRANDSESNTPIPDSSNGYTNGLSINHSNGISNGHQSDQPEPKSGRPMSIAIIGMSCRTSGDVSTPDEFWELCSRARSGWSTIPPERFNNSSFHHPNPDKKGCHNPIGGHFLKEDLGLFDAGFFNITAQEAISMDPQQRILLECTFEALENGGIPKHSIIGKDVGVFIGGSFSDYELNNMRDPDAIPMYQATGCAFAIQSNRISHFFDLRGPSITLDTACSSSLSALHMACLSLQNGDTSQALVGGCHLNIAPEYWVSMSMSRLFSNEGKSFSFDNRGTGFGRGEGCGMIVLKPLDQAINDNDSIRAVIVSSGLNQDGRTPGITMPSAQAQEQLMKSVYVKAGLDPVDTGFIEAHGTGTKVGDPIEINALHSVFGGPHRTARNPLYIGSVKSNIGHLEGASGIMSVIKAAMMLERGFILPNINFDIPNEKIPFSSWNIKVPTTQRPWPRGKRYASINNFGFGGTNGHIVLERAPPPKKALLRNVKVWSDLIPSNSTPGKKLFIISANDKMSLEARIKSMGVYLEQRPEIFQNALMSNLAYTLGQRRSFLSWRVAIQALSSFELIESLSDPKLSPLRAGEQPKVGFVYTGQGAQWHAMGRELFMQYPVFAMSLWAADAHLAKFGASFSILVELSKDAKSSAVGEAHVSQPICTAIQIALTDLLKSWGLSPVAVAGHSSGEIAAAYAAGVLTLESCMAIAYYRGRAIVHLKDNYPDLKGAMMAVGGSSEDIKLLIKILSMGQVRVACINSPSSVTVSGDEDGISELQAIVEERQMFNRKLRVDVAYHSHHMNLVADHYQSSIEELVQPAPFEKVAFHSSLFGRRVEGSRLCASYWVDNLTSPVRFSEALRSMIKPAEGETAVNFIIEVGPHSALEGPIKQTLKSIDGTSTKISYASTLVRNKNAVDTMLSLAGTMFTKGSILDFAQINFPYPIAKAPIVLTDMPRYPWNHAKRYWHESRLSEKHLFRSALRNDILGTLANYSNDLEPTWRNIIRTDDLPWLRDNRIHSQIAYPAAGFLVMAIEAVYQRALSKGMDVKGADKFELRNVTFEKPLFIPDTTEVETIITLRPYHAAIIAPSMVHDEFRIFSWTKVGGWVEHCKGVVIFQKSEQHEDVNKALPISQGLHNSPQEKLSHMREEPTLAIDTQRIYRSLASLGASYVSTFQGLENCSAGESSCTAEIVVRDTAGSMPLGYQSPLILHPTILDQLMLAYWPIMVQKNSDSFYTPAYISKMSISGNIMEYARNVGDRLQAYSSKRLSSLKPHFTIFATASNEMTEPLISIEMTLTPVAYPREKSSTINVPRELCYKLDWEPVDDQPNSVESSLRNQRILIIHTASESQEILKTLVADALENITGQRPGTSNLLEATPGPNLCIFIIEMDKPLLANITSEQFSAMQKIITTSQAILWVVRGAYTGSQSPELNMVTGLSRSIRSESLLKFATLDLDTISELSTESACHTIMKVIDHIYGSKSSTDCEMEFTERAGKLYTPRIVNDVLMNKIIQEEISTVPAPSELQPFHQNGRALKLAIGKAGAIETLYFVDDIRPPLRSDEVEVQVRATGLNLQDLQIAMGEQEGDFGVECSGTVTSVGNNVTNVAIGDSVVAISSGGYSTYARARSSSTFKYPGNLSFATAASVTFPFCTAYYSLIELGRLSKDKTVLIISAFTDIGQAAIQVAMTIGARIFVTVDTMEQVDLLINEYGISKDVIFYNNSPSAFAALRHVMNGGGADIVLSLHDLSDETWDFLAPFGYLVQISSKGTTKNSGLKVFDKQNATFATFDLTVLATERPKAFQKLLSVVFDFFFSGSFRPVYPNTTISMANMESAFKSIGSASLQGKLVAVPGPNDNVMATPLDTSKNLLKSDATYVVVGGTGGLGRSMTKWMVAHGARNIALISRTGSSGGKVGELMKEMKAVNAKITVYQCDITDKIAVEKLVTQGFKELSCIRGVIHSAMVLHDVLYEKMTYNEYDSVIKPKVAGAWNFHHALKDAPLDFFVCISSAAGAVGNRGQAAYAAANTFLNAFVQYRVTQGLPASSIDLTAVSDVGYLAENLDRRAAVTENLGSESICEIEVLALLGAAINGKMATTCNHHCMTGMKITAKNPPFWTSDAKFSHLREAASTSAISPDDDSSRISAIVSPGAALKTSKSFSEAQEIIGAGISDKVCTVLMLDREEMDIDRSISSYGLDSLVAIEIRNFIRREFEASLQVLELLASGSIRSLAKTVGEKSGLVVWDEVVTNGEHNKM